MGYYSSNGPFLRSHFHVADHANVFRSLIVWVIKTVRSSLGDEPNRPVKSLMYSCDEIVNQSFETMTINIEIQ